MARALLGGGCFWCTEGAFKRMKGVTSALPAYAGGETVNPDYHSVCDGITGHAEIVEIKFDEAIISFDTILDVFFTVHDPTQLNRQGNDIGTQYRSCIFLKNEAHYLKSLSLLEKFQNILKDNNLNKLITTEIKIGIDFYYAEDYHQQYLAKNPQGYCNIKGLGLDLDID